MTIDLNNAAGRQREYDTAAAQLRTLGAMRAEHLAAGCKDGPTCPGPDVLDVMEAAFAVPLAKTIFILAAVGEVGRLEAERVALVAKVAKLEEELLDAQGRLADWDDLAPMLTIGAEVRDAE